MNMAINWHQIRPLNGGQEKGFEELCAQLASAGCPPGARFTRKGTPDAGVECYAILGDGSEWGWQAKYIHDLGDSQWAQIDSSINTALQKHPKLVRYVVCAPCDRPDARVEGRKSAKERWDEHETKWNAWASERGMRVEFVYWGSHELLDKLADQRHVGRVRFWFDVRRFDKAWFDKRFEEALYTAGPRYTPEIHIDLPISEKFEAFGRTDLCFDRQKSRARKIRDNVQRLLPASAVYGDEAVDAATAAVRSSYQAVLGAIDGVSAQPTGPLPFAGINELIRTAEAAIDTLSQAWRASKSVAKSGPGTPGNAREIDQFRDLNRHIWDLRSDLEDARESFTEFNSVASSSLLVLRGDAGTGKTHLLCDVARKRLAEGRPTVLLMGQRFVADNAPWPQALAQLDLATTSAEEFVGALESAAQAAGSRALVLIDAVNEGAGRTVWPNHVAAFLAHLARSEWIGTVLSVRSSYEEVVIPEEVRSRAVIVTHRGFLKSEYDASKTFFRYYGLELPSTPLLTPEFRNPLFLKTLCKGLQAKGERRIPRGFHGITAVFWLYIDAINKSLAETLEFNPQKPLVRKALESVIEKMIDSGNQWLSLSDAEVAVNALLPGGHGFEKSMYRGLTTEGLLVEEMMPIREDGAETVVFIAYERFADHLMAKRLLDQHLDPIDPSHAFAPGGGLAFLCDRLKPLSPGLLEAICIQVPERTGKELITVAPACVGRESLADAFRQSVIWRAYTAFSPETEEALRTFCASAHDLRDTFDALATVATLPDHPFNARFLHKTLGKYHMPDRDAAWGVYLHQAWKSHGAIDRLVDWASSVASGDPVDDESRELSAILLSWTLVSSNRYLRDRATQALTNLLTGRLATAILLLNRFAGVDDPYVAERVYAVAYGVSMRSNDAVAVGVLATCVYGHVFAAGNPPPHILLRDYARGVVERALHLGAAIDVRVELAQPPYASVWPAIPTEEEIKPFLPDWTTGSHDGGHVAWSRNSIGGSVMDGDFARYVIGTNSSSTSHEWLSVRRSEPPWVRPLTIDEQVAAWVADLSPAERTAWERFSSADAELNAAVQDFMSTWFDLRVKDLPPDGSGIERLDTLVAQMGQEQPPARAALEAQRQEASAALDATLSDEHARQLAEIRAAESGRHALSRPPGFDLGQIQRYILKRVFDLGWTSERFGHFDRFSVDSDGRSASKAERMGKKYQWIAYHEIMAFVSDHFRYYNRSIGEGEGASYDGPWQLHLRDIDPSCTLRSLPAANATGNQAPAWWASDYDPSDGKEDIRAWILDSEDLPSIESLLLVTNPADGSRWINGQALFDWDEPAPTDRAEVDVERRNALYISTGYLIREEDAPAFLSWAAGVDFSGHWMPEPPKVYKIFLGEHAWSPASRYFQQPYFGDVGWEQPDQDCPIKVRTLSFSYLREASGFDCSVDDSYTLHLPAQELVAGLGLRQQGDGAALIGEDGRVAAFDPAAKSAGPGSLLMREDLLRAFLSREKLAICWAVIGKKRVLPAGYSSRHTYPMLRISGGYAYSDGKITGSTKYVTEPHLGNGEAPT